MYSLRSPHTDIMGEYEEEWIELAKMAEEAGCDAVELNFSCPQMRLAGMGSDFDPESRNKLAPGWVD
ncbi:MAG: tRNA-dihydrouridine synthase [Bacteroidales bacterium]|nr:tRNA-dihydrouridine synthase [Bacteroidales bacterium]